MKFRILSAVVAVAIAAGCSSTPVFQAGEDAEMTHDGLTRIDRTVMDAVWARKDIDVSGVTKVMFHSLGVEYRNDSGPYSGRAGTGSIRTRSSTSEFQLDADTKALFEEEIGAAFLEEFQRSTLFEVVEEPGPDVLGIHVGLLDVVSRVPPDSVGSSRVFLESVGEATLVLELTDSVSHTTLVRAVDRRAAQSTGDMIESSPPRNRAEIRRLGRRWGQILRDGVEAMIADGLGTAE